MKPFAYSYSWAHVVLCDGPADWRNVMCTEQPPAWGYLDGRVKDVIPLYSRAQVAEMRARMQERLDREAKARFAAEERTREVQKLLHEANALFGNYAETVRPFVHLMVKELTANSHKGDRDGWLKMEKGDALSEIDHHMGKLYRADTDDLHKEHAADVANCCMMLLDVLGLLVHPPEPVRYVPPAMTATPELCDIDRSNPCGWCSGCWGGDE